MGDNRYLYPVSRTKALELKLLDKAVIDRLVSCQTGDEAIKILGETAYSAFLSTLSTPLDVETLINAMMRETKAYLTEIAPDTEVISFLYHSEDILNLKRIIKAFYMKTQFGSGEPEPLSDLGCLPGDQMINAIVEGDYRLFPSFWIPVVQALYEESLKEGFSPAHIDRSLDRLLIEDLHQRAICCKNNYMISLVQIQSDLTNLKTLFRLKQLKVDSSVFEREVLPHGLIESGLLKTAMDEPLNQLPEKLIRFGYDGFIRKVLEVPDQVSQLTRLEKLAHQFYFNHVKQAKYIAFGVEPLVGYGIAKASEAKWLRLILMGIINGFPENWIRERLGEVYG